MAHLMTDMTTRLTTRLTTSSVTKPMTTSTTRLTTRSTASSTISSMTSSMTKPMTNSPTRLSMRRWQGPVVCVLAVGAGMGLGGDGSAAPTSTPLTPITPASLASWATLADPMRPSGRAQAFGGTGGAVATSVNATSALTSALTGAPAADTPRLQATRRNDRGVWIALIDERWRAVGERHGQATVAAIRAGDVVLTEGSQRLTLTLAGLNPTAPDAGRLPNAQPVLTRLNQDRP